MRRGITLVEVIITVTVIGIAGAMVVPSMSQVGVLRAQAAVRTMVADITYAQADAAATQERRVILFGAVAREQDDGAWQVEDGPGYTLFAPSFGVSELSLVFDQMPTPESPERPITRDFDGELWGGATMSGVSFADTEPQQEYQALIFDEFGGPVRDLDSDAPSSGGTLTISGEFADFEVRIQPITGRVVVTRTPVEG